MAFRLITLLVLLSLSCGIGGVSVPSFAECAISYLTHHKMVNLTSESERVETDCDARIASEISNFYDEIHNWIARGVNADNLENFQFVNHEQCIIENLRHFNVSNLFLKSIAYQKLNRVYRSDHSVSLIMTSKQILLNALQVCEPRSFYERHAEKIYNLNMRITNAQAHCLLDHLNENYIDEPYQFSNNTESIDELDASKCNEVVKSFERKFNFVINLARNFSIFGLNPSEVKKCRAKKDKNLIDNMILLTIFPRLNFTAEQRNLEQVRYFEIAREAATSFFQCISMYD